MDVDENEDKHLFAPAPGEEIRDLSQEDLAKIEADLEDEDEEDSDQPSKTKRAKYSGVVRHSTRPKVHAVVYIQKRREGSSTY